MDEILNVIFTKNIDINLMMPWINGEIQIMELSDFNQIKLEFVPTFLNFLRDETNSILQSSLHGKVTPNKFNGLLHSSKYISPYKSTKKTSFSSTKAKTLDFYKTPIKGPKKNADINSGGKNSANTQNNLSNYAFQSSPILCSPLSPPSYSNLGNLNTQSTSTPRHQFKPRSPSKFKDFTSDVKLIPRRNFMGSPRSDQRNVLADYIVPEKKGKRKSLSKEVNDLSDNSKHPNLTSFKDSNCFSVVGINHSKEKEKRRINPTLVKSGYMYNKNDESFSSSFGSPRLQGQSNVFSCAEEFSVNSLEAERRLLKEEKQKFSRKNIGNEEIISNTISHDNKTLESIVKKSILSVSSVTYLKELNILSHIYSELIIYNRVPNIVVEFYFIFQLLTVDVIRDKFGIENQNSQYFGTIDNCAYFSVATLKFLLKYICLLDRGIIKLLMDNPRIINLDEDFQGKLVEINNNPVQPRMIVNFPKSPILSVSFQSETDNRNNFPSTVAFQVFRKQRDCFYETIRIWQMNHLDPGWNFSLALGNKIKYLLNLRSDSTNFNHLARLFQSQLITMCKGDDIEGLSVIMDLKRVNPDKYKRLHERLVTPSKFGGPVPLPSFPGSQEFFKFFITTASNASFNSHLKGVFVSKIMEMNEIDQYFCESEGIENNYDHIRSEIFSNLQSLRLLAKFLGLVEFLPYYTDETLQETIMVMQINVRNRIPPIINFDEILQRAVNCGYLVIAIVWIVEFLSMADPVVFHTLHYLTTCFQLVFIYKVLYIFESQQDISKCMNCKSGRKAHVLDSSNSLFLKIVLGWLFSLPNFPQGLFYESPREAEINYENYKATIDAVISSYSHRCLNCVFDNELNIGPSSVSDNLSEDLQNMDFESISPIKKYSFTTPLKTPVGKKILKESSFQQSPVKTPSKFLKVSMLDTPEGTPQKDGDGDQKEKEENIVLDSRSFADHQVLFLCCPYVAELKNILSEFLVGGSRSNPSGSVRKITPSSAIDRSVNHSAKALQVQLEENFFHNQPSSCRKTLDFVIERIYSNVLRTTRTYIIPNLKEKYLDSLRTSIQNNSSLINQENIYNNLEKITNSISTSMASEVKIEAMLVADKMTNPDSIRPSLKFLMPIEVSEKSLEMSGNIIIRSVQERLSTWHSTHLTPSVLSKELIVEGNKIIRNNFKVPQNEILSSSLTSSVGDDNTNSTVNNISMGLLEDSAIDASASENSQALSGVQNIQSSKREIEVLPVVAEIHNIDVISPSDILTEIKKCIKALIFSSEFEELDIDESAMLNYVDKIRSCIKFRMDMTLSLYRALETLTTDLIVTFAVCLPNIASVDVCKSFLDLWGPGEGKVFFKKTNFEILLVPRTIMLLGQNNFEIQAAAWSKMESILREVIINRGFLSPLSLQDCCIRLLRSSWPKSILEGLSGLIKSLFKDFEKDPQFKDDPELIQLLDWVGWVCAEMLDGEEFE